MKAYIYPITARLNSGDHNFYIENFIGSLEKHIAFLNRDTPSNIGILNIFRYLHKIDYLFLNWIENLPDKKGGKLQLLVLIAIIFPFMKVRKRKIVWTLHNFISHEQSNILLKKWLFSRLMKKSDIILTHATAGRDFLKSISDDLGKKVLCYPHPVSQIPGNSEQEVEKIYDILLWGTIRRYKGIHSFLDLVNQVPELKKMKICLAGKIPDRDYERKIKQQVSENIELRNDYISFSEIVSLIKKSRVILFTYSGDSILSSGALMDSLGENNLVIGPHKGAFADLSDSKIILTYKTEEDLIDLLIKCVNSTNRSVESAKIRRFLEDNTWEIFGKRLYQALNSSN